MDLNSVNGNPTVDAVFASLAITTLKAVNEQMTDEHAFNRIKSEPFRGILIDTKG